MKKFINYAHRGASEYAPENTLLSFYYGLTMGANGIETDVQLSKDGVAVLFHDDTVDRVTDGKGKLSDFTLSELKKLWVSKNSLKDRIVTFEDFLSHFKDFDLTFAIELKGDNTAKISADLLRKYDMVNKTVMTSFKLKELIDLKNYAPEFTAGLLTDKVDDQILSKMKEIGITELCPIADILTKELVDSWHEKGFNVRAWGVVNKDLMLKAVQCGVDGMTVNFPDKLTELLSSK